MKALVYTGPRSLEIRDVPEPVARPGEAIVKVEVCGICGSDMHAWAGHDERRPAPLILGHEAAGIVVSGREPGRRVTLNPLATCGRCPACLAGRNNLCPSRQIISMPPREGAFAEYVAIPEENLVTVPDDVSFHKASLAEPLACGWHAVRLAFAALGRDAGETGCVVLGGGAIGLGAALTLIARGAGAVTVVEPNAMRRAMLSGIGGFTAIDTADRLDGGSAALVVDCAGFEQTRADACRVCAPGGVIVHIGLGSAAGGLDVRRITLQEITFIGTYTYTPEDFRDTAAAIFDGRLGSLDWMEQRRLDDGAAAFAALGTAAIAAPKILLTP